jgi:fucose permease
MFVAIAAMVVLILSSSTVVIFAMVAVIGFALANIFSIIFSMALQKRPERGNEISGLMIMGVAGGAILPPLMGLASDAIGQVGGMLVIMAGMIYLLLTAYLVEVKK